jgi:hypothetical protein
MVAIEKDGLKHKIKVRVKKEAKTCCSPNRQDKVVVLTNPDPLMKMGVFPLNDP